MPARIYSCYVTFGWGGVGEMRLLPESLVLWGWGGE